MKSLQIGLAILAHAFCIPTNNYAREPVDFGRQIRPLLSDKCFLCHGPADETRATDLRLDSQQAAVEGGAIDLDNWSESELLARLLSTDEDYQMPPPESGKSLTATEIETVKQWLSDGAPYAEHWAFVPPTRPSLPREIELKNGSWAKNPIDLFVLEHNEQQGRRQTKQATRSELARRLHLDLTGLPPTIEQLDAFLNDSSPDAYQELVDRLLDSPHFGERWARWWLDAARYADSDGYEKDKPRSVWFYRDWVINAMNRNMPYDEFIVHQIAGDLLPDADQDSRVATGFLRNSMVNEEGGADPEQFRVEAMFDRIDAVGKAVLGITTQCAQCHTHKYDPFSQHEYYQMFAALNDFHEASIACFTPAEAQQRDFALERIQQIHREVKEANPNWQDELANWVENTKAGLVSWETIRIEEVPFEGQKFRRLDDGSILSESYAPTKATNTFSGTFNLNGVTAFRIDALKHPQLPRGGPGRSIYGTGALSEFELQYAPVSAPDKKVKVEFTAAISDVNAAKSELLPIYRDRNPEKDDRVTGPASYAIDGDTKTAWTTDIGPGRRNSNRHIVFQFKEPIPLDEDAIVYVTLKQNHGGWNSDDNQNYLLGRYRFSFTRQSSEDLHSSESVDSAVQDLLRSAEASGAPASQQLLFEQWLKSAPQFKEYSDRIEAAWKEFPETDVQLVVESCPPRESYVFVRGDFLSQGDRVNPGTPAFLSGETNTAFANEAPARLQFAKWLVRDDAPTTSRVIVNRIWQAYFGHGLVSTPEDFGLQSSPPVHPELLDWLAMELVESAWDLKHIHELIVTSATYQQSCEAPPSAYADDPQNVHLSRGARYRVDAEIVRDSVLAISGLLQTDIGGPSVYPPAPDFLFQPPASYGPKIWDTHTDGRQYRRSMYVHQYRSVPYPTMQVFDAPKGDAACIRRERSNTPMQALVALNEPQFVEAAIAMAQTLLPKDAATEASDEDLVKLAFRRATSRWPDQLETSTLISLLAAQRERLSSGELDAAQILSNAGSPMSEGQKNELAAWALVCRVILNLDEVISRQ